MQIKYIYDTVRTLEMIYIYFLETEIYYAVLFPSYLSGCEQCNNNTHTHTHIYVRAQLKQ